MPTERSKNVRAHRNGKRKGKTAAGQNGSRRKARAMRSVRPPPSAIDPVAEVEALDRAERPAFACDNRVVPVIAAPAGGEQPTTDAPEPVSTDALPAADLAEVPASAAAEPPADQDFEQDSADALDFPPANEDAFPRGNGHRVESESSYRAVARSYQEAVPSEPAPAEAEAALTPKPDNGTEPSPGMPRKNQIEKRFQMQPCPIGVNLWIGLIQLFDGPRRVRSLTIFTRDPTTKAWRESATYRPMDLPPLIRALQHAQDYIHDTPLPDVPVEGHQTV